MPKIALEVPETIESVTRPIVMQVIRQISESIGIPQDIPITYPGDALSVPQTGSTLDPAKQPNVFGYSQKYHIEVEETYPEDYALSSVVFRPEQLTFFSDEALDVYMKPAYQRTEVNISVRYRTTDRTQAETWINTVKRKVGRGRQDMLLNVDYHYPIPPALIVMLCQIHEMREANQPYNEDIGAWMRRCFTPRFTVIANQAGKHETFVIRENQMRILGYYDFAYNPPVFDRSNDGGAWIVSFTYRFSYDKCEQIVLQYPLMIHNQVMPREFRDDRKPYELSDVYGEAGLSTSVFDRIHDQRDRPGAWRGRVGLAIPYYDDWLPDFEYPGTQSLTRLLIQVDPADKKALVNLTSLGNWVFHPLAIEYMKDVPANLTRLYESVFNVTMHRRYQLMDTTKIQVNADLDFFYEDDLDEREWYHLHVSLLNDITLLSPTAKQTFCNHGEFARAIIASLDPRLATAVVPYPLPEGYTLKSNLYLRMPTPDCRIFIPDEKWITLYGVDNIIIVLPDPLPVGAVENADGTTTLPTGEVYVPPWLLYTSVIACDGSIISLDGAIKYKDGRMDRILTLPELRADGSISITDFNKVSKYLSGIRGITRDPAMYQNYLVNTIVVQAARR